MKRRILHEIQLDKIAAVDRPCQQPATVAIMKRDYSAQERQDAADAGEALPDGSFPIKTVADLKNAVHDVGRAKDSAKAKSHIIARAKALGATDQLPDDWEVKKADPGHDEGVHMSTAIKKALGLADTATDAEVEAAVLKGLSSVTEMQTSLALITKVAKMSPPVREHYEALLKADTPDAKAKAAELADMKEDEADAAVKKANAGDETVVIEGRTISKRAVGDDMFAVMKAQAVRIASNETALAKAQEATAMAGFAKRASDDFGHLAGTTEERAAVLKFLDGAPAEVKASAEAILKAAEGHAKFAFSRAGAGGGFLKSEDDDPQAKLTKLAKEYQKANASAPGMTFEKAYDAVTKANPELYEEIVNPTVD